MPLPLRPIKGLVKSAGNEDTIEREKGNPCSLTGDDAASAGQLGGSGFIARVLVGVRVPPLHFVSNGIVNYPRNALIRFGTLISTFTIALTPPPSLG